MDKKISVQLGADVRNMFWVHARTIACTQGPETPQYHLRIWPKRLSQKRNYTLFTRCLRNTT